MIAREKKLIDMFRRWLKLERDFFVEVVRYHQMSCKDCSKKRRKQ